MLRNLFFTLSYFLTLGYEDQEENGDGQQEYENHLAYSVIQVIQCWNRSIIASKLDYVKENLE